MLYAQSIRMQALKTSTWEEAHIKLLEDHKDDGDDQLRAVLALQDRLVGVLDHAGLARRLHNVIQLHLHVGNATSALQHLQQQA